MGLDMYLEAELFISNYPGGQNAHLQGPIETLLILNGINARGLRGMTFEVGYWRKANAIHNWFVQNIQDGEDNCQRSYVGKEDLARLRHECNVVLTRHKTGEEIDEELEGVDLLPPTAGFFFGGTEKDEGYYNDLEQTIEIIDKVMSMDDRLFDFYYRASW